MAFYLLHNYMDFIFLFISKYTVFLESSPLIKGLISRFDTIERKTANIVTERGYNRIINYPEFWFFGAGAYRERFDSRYEFHSLFGNVQVSYGIIGSLLFFNILYSAVRKGFSKKWYFLVPIFIYGVTHNGIRNGLFWVLLSLLVFNNSNISERGFYDKR